MVWFQLWESSDCIKVLTEEPQFPGYRMDLLGSSAEWNLSLRNTLFCVGKQKLLALFLHKSAQLLDFHCKWLTGIHFIVEHVEYHSSWNVHWNVWLRQKNFRSGKHFVHVREATVFPDQSTVQDHAKKTCIKRENCVKYFGRFYPLCEFFMQWLSWRSSTDRTGSARLRLGHHHVNGGL